MSKILENGGPITPDQSGYIPFNRYLQITVAILEASHAIEALKFKDFRQKRLDLMMSNRMDRYRQLVKLHLEYSNKKRQGVCKSLLRRLAVPETAWT